VVDPLTQSAEECLEVLSSCLSSTYTGMLELGAGDATREAVAEAWRLYITLDKKAADTYTKFKFLVHLAAILAWLAILLSVVKTNLHMNHIHTHFLGAIVVMLPIISGSLTGVVTTFSHRDKWARVKWGCAEITKLIYFYRCEVGPYCPQSAEGENDDDESQMSSAARKREARKHFTDKVSSINSQVMNALQDDHWGVQLGVLDQLALHQLPAAVHSALYGQHQTSTKPRDTPQQPEGAGSSDVESLRHLMDQNTLDETDDCVSSMSAEMYFESRIMPLIKKLATDSPMLSLMHSMLTVAVLVCSFMASLLGAFHGSKWIPVALGLAAMLSSLMVMHRFNTRCSATNAALAGLRGQEVHFRSSSTMDRRTPAFKQALVQRTEQLALGVTMAWVGAAVALTADGSDSAVEKSGGAAASQQDSASKQKAKPKSN